MKLLPYFFVYLNLFFVHPITYHIEMVAVDEDLRFGNLIKTATQFIYEFII